MNYIRICWVLYQTPGRFATRNPTTHLQKVSLISLNRIRLQKGLPAENALFFDPKPGYARLSPPFRV